MDWISDIFDGCSIAFDFIGGGKNLLILAVFVVMYINSVIKSEKLLTQIEDEQRVVEKDSLKKKVGSLLSVFDQQLFDKMQESTYRDGNNYDKIVVHKGYGSIKMAKKDFFRDHHDAVKDSLYKVVLNDIINDINTLRLADPKKIYSDEQKKQKAFELVGLIKSEIRKRSGSTAESKGIENEILTFETVYDMYINIIEHAQELRGVRVEEVKKRTRQYKVPINPKARDFRDKK